MAEEQPLKRARTDDKEAPPTAADPPALSAAAGRPADVGAGPVPFAAADSSAASASAASAAPAPDNHGSSDTTSSASASADPAHAPAAVDAGTGGDSADAGTTAAANATATATATEPAATGADVDAAPPPGQPEPMTLAIDDEEVSKLSFAVVTNDNTPTNLERLVTLKNIFAKQLPKMPKEYIVRLVMDRRHFSLALLKGGWPIGGICYRPYMDQHFAEIAFCAITASEQVKGYGTKLMNHLKQHVKRQGVTQFLTYADNYAIGYFKKQGFSKTLYMPRERWVGYIKDYDGGTLMECYVHPTIDYTAVPDTIKTQKAFVKARIKAVSQQHIVHDGLQLGEGVKLKNPVEEIPGILAGGWTTADFTGASARESDREWSSLYGQFRAIWKDVEKHDASWPFQEPVDTSEVEDYLTVIKDPIDLSKIKQRLDDKYYKSKEMLKADLIRMIENCKTYNGQRTVFYKEAERLGAYVEKLFQNLSVAGGTSGMAR